MIDLEKIEYPHLERIYNLKPNPHVLLGQEIYWTEKRDGSNIGAYLNEEGLQLRSRNKDKASEDFYKAFNSSEQAQGVLELLQDAQNWGNEYVIFGELLTKGKSPTKIELHETNEFVVFDIWDSKNERFMNYNGVHQHCHHFGIPIVELYGICNVNTIDALYAFKDRMLEKAKECIREGRLERLGERHRSITVMARDVHGSLPILKKRMTYQRLRKCLVWKSKAR